MPTPRPSRTAHRPSLPGRPVSTHEAGEIGWSAAAQRHAVGLGSITRVRRGVLVGPHPDRPSSDEPWQLAERGMLLAARAATLTCPRAAVSHSPAALAYGLPVLSKHRRACLTVPAGTALRSLADVHLHRATLLDEDVVQVHGYRTLTAARTVLDAAREHGVSAGVIAADHALREGLIDPNELAAVYERCAHRPGRRAARLTLLLADGIAESPLESLSRLRMSGAGLPPPRPQVSIADRFGRFIARCDFYWDEFGVIGEADGEAKYRSGDETPVERRRRQGLLEDTGLVAERWGWAEILDFGTTAQRLQRAFGRGTRSGSLARQWIVLPDDRPRPFAPGRVANRLS